MTPVTRQAKRNDLIPLLRAIAMPTTKQPGRRYGPAPKSAPHPEMQAPKPMTIEARTDAYRRSRPGPRASERQAAQAWRMAELHGEASRDGGKGLPTPKQKKVRRG